MIRPAQSRKFLLNMSKLKQTNAKYSILVCTSFKKMQSPEILLRLSICIIKEYLDLNSFLDKSFSGDTMGYIYGQV